VFIFNGKNKYSLNSCFLFILLINVSACVSHPKDITSYSENYSYGAAFKGTLRWVAPIYLPDAFPEINFSETSGNLGSLVAASLWKTNEYLDQLMSISQSAGTGVGTELERYGKGHYCQYFVELQEGEFLKSIITERLQRDLFSIDEDDSDEFSDEYEFAEAENQEFIKQRHASLQRNSIDQTQKNGENTDPNAIFSEDTNMIVVINSCLDIPLESEVVISKYESQITISKMPEALSNYLKMRGDKISK